MSEQDISDALIEQLEKRKKSGAFPKKAKFDEEGDSVIGTITMIQPNFFNPEKTQYFIRSAKDQTEYSLPSNMVLIRLLEQQKAKVGDYVLVRYLGSNISEKSGNPVKIFEASVVPEAEAAMLKEAATQRAGGAAAPASSPSVPTPPKQQVPVQKPVAKVTPKAEPLDPRIVSTAKSLISYKGEIASEELAKELQKWTGTAVDMKVLVGTLGYSTIDRDGKEFIQAPTK